MYYMNKTKNQIILLITPSSDLTFSRYFDTEQLLPYSVLNICTNLINFNPISQLTPNDTYETGAIITCNNDYVFIEAGKVNCSTISV